MRFNGYRAAQINGVLAPGFSTRQGMRALEEVFAQTMPREMGFDYSGMSFQEKVAEEGIPPAAVFGFSLLVVFLLLAAQYESWTLPFGVLLGTPIAVLGAVGALWIGRFQLDVFSQIGLVMVIGLAAKNAILIVEFAKEEHERGADLVEAAPAAARLRLRPILMTAFAFILGVVPLVLSSGAGANSRRILGTTVLGGMLAATIIAIFIVFVTFYVSERFGRRRAAAPMLHPISAPIAGGSGVES
jgi:HAE1 family hydrophobic/amphiphilic exporter-1